MPTPALGARMSDAPPSQTLDAAASVEGLLELARARAKAGDAEGAGRTFAAALHLAETHNLWGPTARAQTWLAGIDVRRGRLSLARERLDRARAICNAHPVGPDVQAEVSAQLGQVLVFQGQVGPGVAMMAESMDRYRALGLTAACDELELALAAVQSRVEQAVKDSVDGSADQVYAWLRRAEVRLGLGSRRPALDDLRRAWDAGNRLPIEVRTQVGLRYARLLSAEGSNHEAAALTVLQTIRPAMTRDQRAQADAIITEIQSGGAVH